MNNFLAYVVFQELTDSDLRYPSYTYLKYRLPIIHSALQITADNINEQLDPCVDDIIFNKVYKTSFEVIDKLRKFNYDEDVLNSANFQDINEIAIKHFNSIKEDCDKCSQLKKLFEKSSLFTEEIKKKDTLLRSKNKFTKLCSF